MSSSFKDYKRYIGYFKEVSGAQVTMSQKVTAATKAFAAQGTAIKNWWGNLSGISKFSVIATGAILTVQAIDAAIVAFSETWEEKVARLEMEISVNDEEIQKLGTEIDELENLQEALEGAKGNKAELAKIYNDLNDKIGVSTELLSGEEKAWHDANEAIKDQILIREQLEQKLISENHKKYGQLFEANGIDQSLFGADFLAMDYGSGFMQKIAKTMSTMSNWDFASDKVGSDVKLQHWWNKIYGISYDKYKDEIESGEMTQQQVEDLLLEKMLKKSGITAEEWTDYWTTQVDNAYAYFDDAINSYSGYGGESFARLLIKNAVESGSNDLDGEIAPLLEYFNTDELDNAIDDFKNSLLDNNADTAAAISGLDAYFDAIKNNYPAMASFLDDYKEIIISTSAESIEATSSFASDFEEQFTKLTGVSKNSVDSIQKYLSSLSPDEFTMVTKAISNGLLDDVSSLEALKKKIGILTDLKTEIGGVAAGFNNATTARNNFQTAMDGIVEYDTNFQSYADAYNTLQEEINKNTINSKTASAAIDYLMGAGASDKYSDEQIKAFVNSNLKTMYSNEESYGKGLLQMLSEIDRESAGIVNSWAKINSDGSFDFDIDINEIDELAKAMGTTEQGVWSMLESLQMLDGDIQFFDTDSILEFCDGLGFAGEIAGKNAINIDALGLALDAYGIDISTASGALQALADKGYILLDSSVPIEEFCGQLEGIGVASGDASTGLNVNISSMVSSLKELGYGEEDILKIIGDLKTLKDQDGSKVDFEFSDGDSLEAIEVELLRVCEDKETVVSYLANTRAIDAYKKVDDSKKALVTFFKNSTQVDNYNPKNIYRSVIYDVKTRGANAVSNAIAALRGGSNLNGTAHIKGTAFVKGTSHADGNIGAKKTETALMGEEKPEIWVHSRTGDWELVDHPQFGKVRKGDIIFDGDQTKELLKQGQTGTFGKAFINGTVPFGSGSGGGSSSTGSNKSSNSSKSSTSKTSNKKSTSSSNADETVEKIDWIEIAINRLERAIEKVAKTASSAYKTLKDKLGATVDEIGLVNQEIALQQKAYNRYMQEAESVALSSDLKKKVQSGAINISEYDDKTAELISTYRDLYEKGLAAADSVEELHEQLASLYADNFDNIKTDYENQIGLIEHLTNSYNTGIDELEARGYLASKSYYEALQRTESQKKAVLEKELDDLTTAFSQAMASGEIAKYSDEWYQFQSSINGVKEELQEANVAMLEFAKSAKEVEWEHFDYLQERIARITGEADFFIDLLSREKLFDEKGKFTDEGMATAGLHGQNYNTYMAQADMYAKEAESLQAEIEKDPYNTDLIARRDELLDKQQEAILAAKDEKDAIGELIKEGFDKELESLGALIDGYKDAIDQARDLHDFNEKISDHTSEISMLQKQITAYEGMDDTEEGRAKLQQLRTKLREERENLQETEYDKYISDQKELLDSIYSRYEEIINLRLDNIDLLISQTIGATNQNAASINDTLVKTGNDVGYAMSENIKSIWDSSVNSIDGVITDYGEDFLSKQTALNATINSINAGVQALVAAGDKEAADTISNTKSETAADSKVKPLAPTTNANTNKQPASTSTSKSITVGGKINAGNAKIYDYRGDTSGEKQTYAKDPIYTVLKEQNGWIQVRYHKLSSGVSGWFKKSDVKAYKTGGIVDETGIAWLDGTKQSPEIVLNAQDTQNFLELNDYLRALSSQGLSMREASWDYAPNGMVISHGIGADISSLASRVIGDNGTSVTNAESATVTFGDINIAIDHVENYDDFVTKLQHDKKFEKMMQAITVDRLVGKSSLAKNKFNWNR